jgi:hypothetical protein
MRDYPGRLYHHVPGWVKCGAAYHIRIRAEPTTPLPLNTPELATNLLVSARLYHESVRWYCRLFLLMPDHLHTILCFPLEKKMSDLLGAWKGYQAKHHPVIWQDNYFDHRIRNRRELDEKVHYIRLNPVVKGLCSHEDDWPWWYSGDF